MVFFVISVGGMHYMTWTWSPLLFSLWFCVGAEILALLLTFVQNSLVKHFQVDEDHALLDILESDASLDNKERYKRRRRNVDEEYEGLVAEDKFARFSSGSRRSQHHQDTSPDAVWKSFALENNFQIIRILALLYAISAWGIQAWIYLWLVLGVPKYGLDTKEFNGMYVLIIVLLIVVLLKLQPFFMGMAMFGGGCVPMTLGSMMTMIGFSVLYGCDSTNTVAGYFGTVFCCFSVWSIDTLLSFSLTRYCAMKPTYFFNTWYQLIKNITLGVSIGTAALVWPVAATLTDFDHVLLMFLITSAVGFFFALILCCVCKDKIRVR